MAAVLGRVCPMVCKWCHQQSSTDDFCEWCKRPLRQVRKVESPGAGDVRTRELLQVRRNDRLLLYSMLGVVLLTFLIVGYTVLVQPPEAEALFEEINFPVREQPTNKTATEIEPSEEPKPDPAPTGQVEGAPESEGDPTGDSKVEPVEPPAAGDAAQTSTDPAPEPDDDSGSPTPEQPATPPTPDTSTPDNP